MSDGRLKMARLIFKWSECFCILFWLSREILEMIKRVN